jgi:hypothetical protein
MDISRIIWIPRVHREKDILNHEITVFIAWIGARSRGASLFCLSRQDEAMVEKDPGDSGFAFAGHRFRIHLRWFGYGISVQVKNPAHRAGLLLLSVGKPEKASCLFF